MKFELEPYHRGFSDEALLSELRQIAAQLNKTAVTRSENDDLGKYGSHTYVRRFGSWFKALEAAGLEKTRTPMNLSEEELFHNLEEVWTRLGRQPKYVEMQKPLSRFSAGTYENRFGSWRKALEKLVNFVNGETYPSIDRNPDVVETRCISGRNAARGVNWRLRFIIMRRDSFRCGACGRSPATDAYRSHQALVQGRGIGAR